jgi:hypothetical protein
MMTIGVLGMPKPEAHFYNDEPFITEAGVFAHIDVGLHDT